MDESSARLVEGRLRRWVLLTGGRRRVAGGLLVAAFATLVLLPPLTAVDVRSLLVRAGTAALFDTLLSGTILLVSVVVSVASLAVSGDLRPVGRQRRRVESTAEFRRTTAEVIDEPVSPTRPSAFLRAITRSVLQRTQRLEDAVADLADDPTLDGPAPRAPDDGEEYLSWVSTETERVNRTLEDPSTGSFASLLAALEYDHASQLVAVREFSAEHDLPEEAAAAVEDLTDALQHFAVAREYFKSLYYEREFADLSRDLIYVSVPTIVVLSYVVLAVDVRTFEGAILGIATVHVVVAAAYTVALAPFMTLAAYVLRVATIARTTLSAGPFVVSE